MSHASPTVLIGLLRDFTLRVDSDRIPLSLSAQRLVALLALERRPVTRAFAAGVLWPEATANRASANLRSSLWRANRACDQLIRASAQRLTLAPDVVVDIQVAVQRAQCLIDHSARCDDVLDTATRSDLSADLLPDWYEDDWLLMEREQYRQLRLHALEALCERLIAAQRFGEAIDAGLAAVRAEPLRESAHQVVVKAHLAEGNRWEAVRQYQRCRQLLLDELGVEPSRSLLEMVPVGRHLVDSSAS